MRVRVSAVCRLECFVYELFPFSKFFSGLFDMLLEKKSTPILHSMKAFYQPYSAMISGHVMGLIFSIVYRNEYVFKPLFVKEG